MNQMIKWAMVLVCATAINSFGAFEKPTTEQLKAAAKDPSLAVDLLKDASIDQAAETVKDVIIQIVKLNLKPEDRNARVSSVVGYLFMAVPKDQWPPIAISLAKFVAASPTASMSPALLSAIQQAIIEVAGMDVGSDFGNAYNLAMQSVAGAPGGGKNVPPQPPPPPVALPYEGQRLD